MYRGVSDSRVHNDIDAPKLVDAGVAESAGCYARMFTFP